MNNQEQYYHRKYGTACPRKQASREVDDAFFSFMSVKRWWWIIPLAVWKLSRLSAPAPVEQQYVPNIHSVVQDERVVSY